MTARSPEPKPWPMKWIVLVIIIFIPIYTFLTLHYRKTNTPFQPAQDLSNRATVLRLLKGGWVRIPVSARRPADGLKTNEQPTHAAVIEAGLPGLSAELTEDLVEKPQLAASITQVIAPSEITSGNEYTLFFTCTLADQKHQLLDVQLYVKDQNAVIIPNFEKVAGQLLTRTNETSAWLDIPTSAWKPGHYRVTLAGAGNAKAWNLTVK